MAIDKAAHTVDLRRTIAMDEVSVVLLEADPAVQPTVKGILSMADVSLLPTDGGYQQSYLRSVYTVLADWVGGAPAVDRVLSINDGTAVTEYRILGELPDAEGVGIRFDLGPKYANRTERVMPVGAR